MSKEEILDLLRQTAEANGSVPPGKDKFARLTGVAESEWLGKYWARWSDLVSEAGYSPGKMQGSIPEEDLLKHYLALVEELGHVPTAPELRIKAYNSEDFPAASTFTRNSSKKRLVGKAISFCKKSPKHKHLLSILEAAPHEFSETGLASHNLKRDDGYVYLLKFGDDYKIGSSKNVSRRFREIKTQMPMDGEIIHNIKTGDPEGIESYWHRFFTEKRTKGEWFRLTSADVKYFKKRRLM